jgi:hypothetical protein
MSCIIQGFIQIYFALSNMNFMLRAVTHSVLDLYHPRFIHIYFAFINMNFMSGTVTHSVLVL